MHETIDLISHAALRELRAFTSRTRQPTHLELMDVEPIRSVANIEITEEHITLTYNQKTTHRYNANEVTQKEWSYKYNDDPEFVRAIGAVIDLARKHVRDMPDNVACPPGCAECCSGYEPFVNREDVQRIAAHLGISYEDALRSYVVQRESADGYAIGYLKKVTDDIASRCVFLKGATSGRHYCGIYEARPHDCAAFTPIGCEDVDRSLRHDRSFVPGLPFRPRHPEQPRGKRRR
ncbi:MAG: YkgJ family cysteine cluster protein [Candidatus Eremiobacteraeota bacterium]|nr:YkgJ family cysteine cluster protein [Candidatus Eremiobacteraeota bacterium]MBC5802405.1 YkgJ family cysteine cluster protein [Candidatus Eremiobacteraeota bacterium]MBC5820623.1 YkgJ family cysteine cluster protein [Candidatus Eremiobacteraeota bacterium]